MADTDAEDAETIERPDEPWKYPYVAGIVDFGSNLFVRVSDVDDAKVGYRINAQLQISSPDQTSMGFLDEFCQNHRLRPRLATEEYEGGERYRLDIARRDDLRRFILLIEPYLIHRQPVAVVLI